MTDRKKVMQALQNCPDCGQCYTGGPGFGVACRDQLRRDALVLLKEYEKERLEWISAVAKLTAEKEKLLKEQEAMNVDAFVQWCIDSHIMGDATVRGIKYWVGKYKETKEGW